MTFRTRLVAALVIGALVPLGIFGLGVRREMTHRLDQQADQRVAALVGVVRADLAADIRDTRTRLRVLASQLESDNRFRLAAEPSPAADRRWLLDWAAEAMRGAGFSLLQVQDSAGRILSSGHFRNDFDRVDPGFPRTVAVARETGAVARVRLPNGVLQVLAEVDSFAVGGRRFTLVGGRATDSLRLGGLPPGGEIGVELAIGDSAAHPAVAAIELPFIDQTGGEVVGAARVVVTRDLEPIRALRRSVDGWLAVALGVTLALALGLAAWLANVIARPIAELAEKTSRVDLDRLDQEFATGRDDEIGALALLLDSMTARLRSGAARLRATERRAAVGDLARQINHDIKNGLTPIRHVVRHLTEVAERDPSGLAAIYAERRPTLESSVEYLDGLARNYATLSPSLDRSASDPNVILREIARANGASNATIELTLAESIGPARVEALVLRRILENLVGNAVDALEGRPGRIVLASASVGEGDARRIRLTVADSGRGMHPEELERAFDDFYTTKAAGTGLGLSVVRRLVGDLGGALKVETAPGQGSTFIVEIPAG